MKYYTQISIAIIIVSLATVIYLALREEEVKPQPIDFIPIEVEEPRNRFVPEPGKDKG